MELINIIKEFEKTAETDKLDLTSESDSLKIETLADKLYNSAKSLSSLRELEKEMIKVKSDYGLMSHSAVKIALSKKILSETNEKIHFTIVFAVYKEHNRILTKKEHPHGEDFLIRKIKQLEHITGEFPDITWDMEVVDDGCPYNSGKIAEKILAERYKGNNVKVLYLQDAVDAGLESVKGLKTTDDSRKGGAIEYGMQYAAQRHLPGHIIIYTDADLSTHLGQIGLLAEPVIKDGKYAAVASRRENASVVIKKGTRNLRGKLFIYLWKRIIRRLDYITDTQCGFKAFRAETAEKIVVNTIEKKFAFDIELLLKTDILKRKSIAKVPIAWIDSDAESTTTDLQPYTDMLKAVADMYFMYLPPNASSHSFAYFVKSLTNEQWEYLVDRIPDGIAAKSAIHYDVYDEIKVEDFKKILDGMNQ